MGLGRVPAPLPFGCILRVTVGECVVTFQGHEFLHDIQVLSSYDLHGVEVLIICSLIHMTAG